MKVMTQIWPALAMMAVAAAFVVLASPSSLAATIEVTGAWARATPGSAKNAAVYFTMTNTGAAADRLVSAQTQAAEMAELHETTMMGGMMHMAAAKAVDIPAGGKVIFAPQGRHLMLMNLKKPLRKGDDLSVTLHFEKAGAIGTKVPVLDVAALGPQHQH
jgi:copper(I)-binding protein